MTEPGDYGDVSESTPLLISTPAAHHNRSNNEDSTTRGSYTRLCSMSASSNQITRDVYVRTLSTDSVTSIPPMLSNGREADNDNAFEAAAAGNFGATSSSEFNFKENFQLRLVNQYPLKYIIIHSIMSIMLSSGMIVCERLQDNHFTMNDFSVLSYRTLNGFILWASATNIAYSLMALITTRVKRYFLIQLTSILFLTGALMSFFYLIIFNIVVLVLAILDQETCDYTCIIVRSAMILIGVLINVLNVTYYLLIQYDFLGKLNNS